MTPAVAGTGQPDNMMSRLYSTTPRVETTEFPFDWDTGDPHNPVRPQKESDMPAQNFPTVQHNGRTYVEDEMILTDEEINAIIRFEDDEDAMLAHEQTVYAADPTGGAPSPY